MGKLDRYSIRAYRNIIAVTESDRVAALLSTASSSSHLHARWGRLYFPTIFWSNSRPKSPRCVVFLFKARRLNGLGPCGDHRASLPCLTRRRSVSEFQRRGPSYVGSRVRISLPPASSQLRTRPRFERAPREVVLA